MTIFDIINSVLFTKKRDCLTSIDQENTFAPYMVNRWVSMYSSSVIPACNKLNKYLSVFDDKKMLFSLFLNTLPKVKSKRLSYIKKQKEQQIDIDEKIALIAKNKELSQREVQGYIAFLKN